MTTTHTLPFRVLAPAIALMVAPALSVTATLVDPTRFDASASQEVYLEHVSQNSIAYLVAGILLSLSFSLLLLASIGLAQLANRLERAAWLRAGAMIFGAGAAMAPVVAFSGFAGGWAAAIHGMPSKFIDTITYSPFVYPAALGFIVSLTVGAASIGVGLWRSRAVPRWAAVLLMAAPLAIAVPFGPTCFIVLAVPFALAGRKLASHAPVLVD